MVQLVFSPLSNCRWIHFKKQSSSIDLKIRQHSSPRHHAEGEFNTLLRFTQSPM